MKRLIAAVALTACSLAAWGSGSAEGGSARGRYLAGSGLIIQPAEVVESSYIAYVDYRYPRPKELIGVSLYTGHRQVSGKGQEELLQIGIQAQELPFDELPPMNLAFVIDHSGSMAEANKLDWVKKAFDVFIRSVRDTDFVSLVIFDTTAQAIFPSTRMSTQERRAMFRSVVQSIRPGGSTNVPAGMDLGYEEVMKNFRKDYTNRVLLLTDGLSNVGSTQAMLEQADSYRALGVNVSTIGVGTGFDPKLMEELARRGGGSSRFIADMKEMENIFGGDLDRMAVPAARDLRMTLEFLMPVEILNTWGYDNSVKGRTVSYALPTLHHRDYETILAEVRIQPTEKRGRTELARFTLSYKDVSGAEHRAGPFTVTVELVGAESPVTGYSDGMVVRSGSMLRFARALKSIGEVYYAGGKELDKVNALRTSLWKAKGGASPSNAEYLELTSPEITELESAYKGRLRAAVDLTVAMKKELVNVRLRSDDQGFDDEIRMMDEYLAVFGKELELESGELARIGADTELAPRQVEKRPLTDELYSLFQEIALDIDAEKGVIAVSGFATSRGTQPRLVAILNEMGVVELAKIQRLTVVERSRLEDVLKEQQLAVSDLVDTEKAVSVGKMLAAGLILTGSVIEMPSSVVIFGRIVNVETSEVESAAQVILPKTGELATLL